MAGTLGIHLPPGGDLQQAVLDHLGSEQTLLVLDNFEHLLDEATLVRDILISCPQVKVIVTSREKLNLDAETLFPLRGLEIPPPDNLQKVEEFDAVRLFLQKARQVRPGYSLSDEKIPAVIRICRLVDGIPLGIPPGSRLGGALLSPSRSRTKSAPTLTSWKEPSGRTPAIPACGRYLTLPLTVKMHKQKAIFRKLSVFRGGFNLAAAEALAAQTRRP